MNQSETALNRKGLIGTSGPPACPVCGNRLKFGSDRTGRTTESCPCGHHSYVDLRRRTRAADRRREGGAV